MVAAVQIVAEPEAPRARLVVGICFTIAALEGYDIQAVGVAGPSLRAALHLAERDVANATSLSMVGLVFGSILGGWFADRVGRKPVLLVSVIWFGLFSLLTASVNSPEMLLISRFLAGLGFGGAMPNMIAIASEISSRGRRAATTTTMFVGMPAGGSLATLVALAVLTGVLPKFVDWRLIFAFGGAAPLAIAPLIHLFLPETQTKRVAGEENALHALFGERRTATTLVMWSACGLTLVVMYLLLGWLPMLVVAEGLTRVDGALAAMASNVAGVAGGIIVGLLVDRYKFRWPLFFTYAGLFAAMGLLSIAGGVAAIMVLSGLAGFFVIAAQYNLFALVPMVYPKAATGRASGAAVGAGRLGAIAGPLLASALREHHASPGQVLGATMPAILVAGGAAFLLTYIGKVIED